VADITPEHLADFKSERWPASDWNRWPTSSECATLANFANDAGLLPLGGNLYQQTDASGAPVTGLPGDPGFAVISQGYLESSNVDPVKEITDLISAQRAYEMNSKVIQAASDMASTVSKNLG